MKINLKYIVFEATSICNLNCRYCYNIWKRPHSSPYYSNSYAKAIRTLKRLFKIAHVTHIAMSGGEPLLSQRFQELVLFCRLKKKDVTVITNGNGGSPADYKELLGMGVNVFELPLHSHKPETHDYLTRTEGSWENAVRSIRAIRALGGRAVVVIVVTKKNYKDITDTILFIKSLGVTRIMLNRFNIGGRGITEKHNLLPGFDALNYTFATADALAEKHNLIITSNVCTPHCIIDPAAYPHIKMGSCSAQLMNLPLTVDIQGNMRLCNHSPVVAGNIFKQKLEHICDSHYVNLWKNSVPEYCVNCDKFTACRGGCRAACEQLGSTVQEVDPLVSYMASSDANQTSPHERKN